MEIRTCTFAFAIEESNCFMQNSQNNEFPANIALLILK